MNYLLEEIIEINLLEGLTDSFSKAFDISTAIIKPDGSILTKSGSKDICTKYFQYKNESEKYCIDGEYKKNTIKKHNGEYVTTICARGMIDASAAIKLNGRYIGHISIGPYFTEKPSKKIEEEFTALSVKFPIESEKCIEEFKSIPVVDQEKQKRMLDFLLDLTNIISVSCQNKINQYQETQKVKSIQENFENLFLTSPDCISISRIEDGTYINVNDKMEEILGYTKEQIIGKNSIELGIWKDKDVRNKFLKKLEQDEKIDNFEIELLSKTNETKFVLVSSRIINFYNEDVILSVAKDITDRKIFERKFIESEKRYRIFLEAQPDILFRINDKLIFIDCFVNNGDSLLFPPDLIIGKPAETILPKNLFDLLKTNFEKTIKTGVISTSRYKIDLNDDERWFEARMVPYSSEEVLIISRDITKEYKNERALFESEQKFKSIFNNANCGIILYDKDFKIIEVNEKSEEFFEYSANELIKKDVRDISYTEEDSDNEDIINDLITGKRFSYRKLKKYITRTGEIRWGDVSVSAIRNTNNELLYFLSILIDVTDEITNEIKFKNLTENLLGVTYICENDENYTMTFLTQNIEKLCGYKSTEFLNNKIAYNDLIHPEDKKIVRKKINDSLQNKCRFNLKYRIITKDLTTKWVEENGLVVAENEGKDHIEGYIHDITHTVETEEKLLEYKTELEGLVKKRTKQLDIINKELHSEIKKTKKAEDKLKNALLKEKEFSNLKSRFISTASHEFRTPLTTILSSVDLIDLYMNSQKYSETIPFFEKVRRSVKHLTNLIDDILILNKTDETILKFDPSLFEIVPITQQVINDLVFDVNSNRNIIFNTDLDKSSRCMLDKNLYTLICSNLITNAMKYSDTGSEIIIELNESDDLLILTVRDFGIGINNDDLELIFEQFHRGRNTKEIAGTGLGLSIAKRAVNIHGGEIRVESQINKGTKFTVTLPSIRGNNE